ncbi:MAG: hypothetical protein ACTHOO_10475 [Alcanivorax sp.]
MARGFVLGLDGIEAMSTSEGEVVNTQTDPGVQTVIEANAIASVENPNFELQEKTINPGADLNNFPTMDV